MWLWNSLSHTQTHSHAFNQSHTHARTHTHTHTHTHKTDTEPTAVLSRLEMESQWHRARVVALNYSNKLSTIEHGHYMDGRVTITCILLFLDFSAIAPTPRFFKYQKDSNSVLTSQKSFGLSPSHYIKVWWIYKHQNKNQHAIKL